MLYNSLKNIQKMVSFKEAVLQGLSQDGGLYVPTNIPKLDVNFFKNLQTNNIYDIATSVIYPYIKPCISKTKINEIIHNAINFCFPIKKIDNNIYVLELFHGPTLAFKDIGARFMSECLQFFSKEISNKITVLVATSGDTGGAVANSFHNKNGIEVIILYPHNGISKLQKEQINYFGNNIFSVEINGDFDDCQNIVKKAFLDTCIKKRYKITSANSINIARWLPQMFYYFLSYKKIYINKQIKPLIFSIPSGNFGNICAGMTAEKMGLPIEIFIASTNCNDTIPRFLNTRKYIPRPVKKTISNAMDISNPSNFPRIWNFLYKKDFYKLNKKMLSYKFTDHETIEIIKKVWMKYKYILDPHGAIGYLGIKKYFNKYNNNTTSIFLETAHPIKFINCFPSCIKKHIKIPKNFNKYNTKKHTKNTILLPKSFNIFKDWMLSRK